MADKVTTNKYVNVMALGKDRFMREISIPAETEGFYVNDKGYITIDLDGENYQFGLERSENGLTKFSCNNDGHWKERYVLINQCIQLMATLGIRKDEYFAWFFKDKIAMMFKKDPENEDEWSWNRLKVHTASIYQLRHILGLLEDMHKDYAKKYPEEYKRRFGS